MYESIVALHRLLQCESWPFWVLYDSISPKSLIGAEGGPSLQKQCALAWATIGKQQIDNATKTNTLLRTSLMRVVESTLIVLLSLLDVSGKNLRSSLCSLPLIFLMFLL